jgi:hypothetical protein
MFPGAEVLCTVLLTLALVKPALPGLLVAWVEVLQRLYSLLLAQVCS